MRCFIALVLLGMTSCALAQYDTVCYGELGCFTNSPPWGNCPGRDIDTLPEDPSEVDTRFFLDTRPQANLEIYYDDMTSLSSTAFDPSKKTSFIIHGFVDGDDEDWQIQMSQSLLVAEDQNVIRVTWKGANLDLNYDQSAVNTEVAGAATGLLLKNMISSFGVQVSNVHCIGHSLGAHICAYVNNEITDGTSESLARISGLDPAGELFETADAVVRLDLNDATFVDVIHTDADPKKGYGTTRKSGNVDFWPNGGSAQPGCDQNIVVGIAGTIIPGTFVVCNHMSAVYFYQDSILGPCPFKSYPCDSYDSFLTGNCITCQSTGCPSLGYHAIDYASLLNDDHTYLQTQDEEPYCEYMTYVAVTIDGKTNSIEGSLYVTLVGTAGKTEQQQLGGKGQKYGLGPGNAFKALTYYATDPGDVTSVEFMWKQEEVELGRQSIGVQEIAVWKGETQWQYTFCGDPDVRMKEKEIYVINTVC